MPLETEAKAEIRGLLDGLKPDDGDLLEALHRVHDRYGYISREAMEVVAEQLRLTAARVYGATTYYSDFRMTPPPPLRLAWCSGPACRLRNAGGIRAAFEAVFGCRLGEDGADGTRRVHARAVRRQLRAGAADLAAGPRRRQAQRRARGRAGARARRRH